MTSPLTKPHALLAGLLLASTSLASTAADNVIDSLTATESVVTFTTTEAKTHSLPTCVGTGNEKAWAAAVNDGSGVYELLAIAEKTQQPVEVVSSQNCSLATGIESVNSVNINYPYDEGVVPVIASNVNFVARTKVTMLEGEILDSVEYQLSVDNQIIVVRTAIEKNGIFLSDFGKLAVGNYTLVTRVTSGTETIEQQSRFVTAHINLANVRENNGNLYIQLPASHGNGSVYLELMPNGDGTWTITDINKPAAFNEFIVTDYIVDFGNYAGDKAQDIRLTSADGNTTITIEQNANGYLQYISNENPAGPNLPIAAPSSLALAPSATGETIGLMAGNFRVDESGAATYSVPLSLPRGIAGVSPSLGLSYNSSAGNGVMGVGWNLNGLSGITRCRPTTEDGDKGIGIAAITLTDNDRFCLDGQKLILVSGTNGKLNSEYRPLLDSQTRVVVESTNGMGPSSFTVERPDGSKSFYGSNSASTRSDGSVVATDGTVISWLISTTQDNMGNAIDYFYKQPETAGYGKNEVVIDQIIYSDHKVTFTYNSVTYNGSAYRQDKSHGYIYGNKIERKARLDSIDIDYANVNGITGSNIRYNLTYHSGTIETSYPATVKWTKVGDIHIPGGTTITTVTDEVWLKEIQQCNNNQCLPATSFDWTVDANDGGSGSTMGSPLSMGDNISSIIPLDVNGDGRQDMLKLYDVGNNINMRLAINSGDGFTNVVSTLTVIDIPEMKDAVFKPADIDGDGYVELLYVDKNTQGKLAWYYYDFFREPLQHSVEILHPKANGGTYNYLVYGEVRALKTNGTQLLLDDTKDNIQLYDADGDALVDLIYRNNSQNTIHFNEGIVNGSLSLGAGTPIAISLPNYRPTGSHGATANIRKSSTLFSRSSQSNNTAATYSQSLFADDIVKEHTPGTINKSNAQFASTSVANRCEINLSESEIYALRNTLKVLPKNIPVVDFNGDGIADLLMRIGDVYTAQNIQGDCEKSKSEYYWAAYVLDKTTKRYEFFGYLENAFNSYESTDNVFVSDFNGDGLGDAFYYGGEANAAEFSYNNKWRIAYSTGVGFTAPQEVTINNADGGTLTSAMMSQPSITDYDSDGLPDIVYFDKSNKSWSVLINNGDSFNASPTTIHTNYFFDNNTDTVMLADFEGEGSLNFLKLEQDTKKMIITDDGRKDGVPINKVTGINNGFGLKTEISYKRLNDHANPVYTKGFGAELIKDFGKGSPVYDLITPQYVVSQVKSDAPSYDATGEHYEQSNTLSVGYHYEGLRAQAGGRGMLGFEKITTVDHQTKISTATTYLQKYPYVGMPEKTEADIAGFMLIKYAKNEWDNHTFHTGRVTSPYLKTSIEKQISVDTGGVLSTTKTSNVYTPVNDSYANLSTVTVENFEGDTTMGTPFKTTTTVNTYTADNETKWWLGRITNSAVTHYVPLAVVQPSILRNSSFSYYEVGHTNEGMLKTEKINGLTTLHCYDVYGNEVTTIAYANFDTIDCSSTNLSTLDDTSKVFRRKWAEYDTSGRYVLSQGNDKFTTNTISFNSYNGYGQPRQSTDINGVVTEVAYDSFGRQYFTTNSLGQKTVVARALDSSGGFGSYYRETVSGNGKPTTTTYFDKLGRSIRKTKQGFDGRLIYQDTRYDKLGRAIRQSNPYYAADAIYWNKNKFDMFNRAKQGTSASGVVTNYKYNGLTTTTQVIDSNRIADPQVNISLSNVLGETISVISNASVNPVTYNYNAAGNLVKVTNIDDTIITTGYDDYGRKVNMIDPSKGKWKYGYNALNELVSQESANGYITYNYRDSVGRIVLKSTKKNNLPIADIDYVYLEHQLYTESDGAQLKFYDYDNFGRLNTLQTLIDGITYTQQTTYDQYGRIFQQFDADASSSYGCFNPTNSIVGACRGIQNHYNNYGYLDKQSEARYGSAGVVYNEITAMDAFGNVKEFKQKDGTIVTNKGYENQSGMLKSISATSNGMTIQNNTYQFDNFGNLRTRENNTLKLNTLGRKEDFIYDNVNRLTHVNNQEKVRYAENGNITWKKDVNNQEGYYCYAGNSPYAVSGIGTSANCSVNNFNYDNNGNMTSGRDRTIVYNHFDKATLITNTSNNSVTSFAYGTNHSRYKRSTTEQVDGKTVTTTTYYLGNIEVINKSNTNVVTTRRNLPGAVEVRRNNNTKAEISYLLKDHLGSIDTITDAKGFIKQKLYFDPWGKKHIIDSANVIDNLNSFTTLSLTALLDVTTRGYTGHESVDHADIIHMNGRIYDPTLGRFLQADPFIQAPKNSQNYNRYSYVINNPLRYVDPSGYNFLEKIAKPFKKLGRSILKALGPKVSGWLVSIGSAWCGPYYAACVAVGNYEIARSQGANSTGALRGAFTAGAMAYVGQQANAQWGQGSWQSVATQATAGGIAADLNGGKFGHGFWAAGFNAFQQGPNSGAGYGQDLNSWGDYASSFGNYMVSSYTRDEMARFARKNGMTLTELNILLTLNSFAGNYIAGSRYDAKTNEMTGFTSREAGVWGVLWDVNDTLLGYQGYLDASGFDYINSANAGSHISYCHSLGTLSCNTLVTKGFAPSASLNSLPFGNVAYGANQRMTQLGKWDIVNGFIFGRMFNWGATSTNCRSIDDALCHGGSNYR